MARYEVFDKSGRKCGEFSSDKDGYWSSKFVVRLYNDKPKVIERNGDLTCRLKPDHALPRAR